VTLELEPAHAAVARANLERAGQAHKVEIRVGPAAESLSALIAERAQPFDLTFIDADKPGNVAYLNGALALTRPGGAIIVDNVIREGGVLNANSPDPRIQGTRALFEALRNEPRLEATALQTVGSKGYDGFVIGRVKEG
ncbi:MAG TPA: class I SAM-dependent methyltransferase, partial [Deinococcales bacterium]|nr:class I SAM-dependent methyltransferase [Deinococcales bacterium]